MIVTFVNAATTQGSNHYTITALIGLRNGAHQYITVSKVVWSCFKI